MNDLADSLSFLSSEQKEKANQLYELLEPLTDPELSGGERSKLRLEVCQKLNISKRTLRRLICSLVKKGALSLARKNRSDKGAFRKMNEQLLKHAIELIKEEPQRSVPELKKLLSVDPQCHASCQNISVKTLGFHLRKAGWGASQRSVALSDKKPYHRFEANFPNELWQGDARDGIPLPHPTKTGKTKMTYLFCFVDDFSRKIMHAKYYWDEKLPRMEDCFRQAVLCFGTPKKVYLDNGSVYCASHFALLLDGIGCRKIHHPAYSAWCKGKIENLMKVLKRFQLEARHANFKTLDELNFTLNAWINVEYNTKIHSTTGQTPNERYLSGLGKHPSTRVTNIDAFNELFLHREQRCVDKYRKVQMFGNFYKVSGLGVGERIEVRYDPFDLKTVKVYHNGKFHSLLVADLLTKEQAIERLPEEKKIQSSSGASVLYFQKIRQKYMEEMQERKSNFKISQLKEEKENDGHGKNN